MLPPMLRLPALDVHQPANLADALALREQLGPGARWVAGGTDLLPNLKLHMVDAEHLVSLRALAELHGITVDAATGELCIGAATRLADLAADPDVLAHAPVLAFAAGRVASPQLRNMGTLGGNLCLDTRCRYINQSELWREALGGCLKSHGTECHVVPGGQGCVAALSSDTAPVLIVHGAAIDVLGPHGASRSVAVADLYDTDGLQHVRLEDGEVLVRVRVPRQPATARHAYRKWAARASIDFPLVSVALRLDLATTGLDLASATGTATLAGGQLAVGVLGPRPRVLDLGRFAGRPVDEALALELGDFAFARCHPLPNVPYDAAYRRERLAVEVRRAVRGMA